METALGEPTHVYVVNALQLPSPGLEDVAKRHCGSYVRRS